MICYYCWLLVASYLRVVGVWLLVIVCWCELLFASCCVFFDGHWLLVICVVFVINCQFLCYCWLLVVRYVCHCWLLTASYFVVIVECYLLDMCWYCVVIVC